MRPSNNNANSICFKPHDLCFPPSHVSKSDTHPARSRTDRLTKAIEVRKGAKSTKANTKTDRRPMFPQARKRASERMKRLLGEEEEDCYVEEALSR